MTPQQWLVVNGLRARRLHRQTETVMRRHAVSLLDVVL